MDRRERRFRLVLRWRCTLNNIQLALDDDREGGGFLEILKIRWNFQIERSVAYCQIQTERRYRKKRSNFRCRRRTFSINLVYHFVISEAVLTFAPFSCVSR